MNAYPNLNAYSGLKQDHIDWLLRHGVTVEAMIRPDTILLAWGGKAADGRFEELTVSEHSDARTYTTNTEGRQICLPNMNAAAGQPWLVFPQPGEVVYWQPKTGELTTWGASAFALGEEIIHNPGTYSFDCHLNVWPDPLEWLRHRRDGIVILDWSQAFDWLRDCPRIAWHDAVMVQARRYMKPSHMPEQFVIPSDRRMAA